MTATLPKKTPKTVPIKRAKKWTGKEIATIFTNVQSDIITQLAKMESAGYSTAQLERIQASMKQSYDRGMRDVNKWIKEGGMEEPYVSGSGRAIKEMANGGVDDIATAFGRPDRTALQGITDEMRGRLAQSGDTMLREASDVYRRIGGQETVTSLITGRTQKDATAALVKEFANNGITSFVAKNGARWNIEAYSRMVARTTQANAEREGFKMRMAENEQDLVDYVGTIGPNSRDACIAGLGQVTYSLSGSSSKFPPLSSITGDGALGPNCVHDTVWSEMNVAEPEEMDEQNAGEAERTAEAESTRDDRIKAEEKRKEARKTKPQKQTKDKKPVKVKIPVKPKAKKAKPKKKKKESEQDKIKREVTERLEKESKERQRKAKESRKKEQKKPTEKKKEEKKKEPTKEEKTKTKIRKDEKELRKRTTEKSITYDKDGKIIFEKTSGKENQIDYTLAELDKMKGATVTHNHPSKATSFAQSFSGADLEVAMQNSVAEMRITGKKFDYSFTPPKGLSKEQRFETGSKMRKELMRKQNANARKVAKRSSERLRLKQITPKEYMREGLEQIYDLDHKSIGRMAEKYGFKYSRVENGS